MMWAIASTTHEHAGPTGGHPLWHQMVVAGAAVGVFVAIKLKEHWDRNQRPRLTLPTGAVLALALCSAASAAIHATVTAEHFEEAFIFGAFFLAASTLQAAWAVLFVYRPNRTLLVAGGVGNAAVIILWALTRTVGLPIGPETWQPEAIGARDVMSTLLELAVVLGAARLFLGDRRGSRARNELLSKSVRTNITI
jgi:hypothetical protein